MPTLKISLNGNELTRVGTADYASIDWRIASSRWEDTGGVLYVSSLKERADGKTDSFIWVENLVLQDGGYIKFEMLPGEDSSDFLRIWKFEELEELRCQCQMEEQRSENKDSVLTPAVPARLRCGLNLQINGLPTEIVAEGPTNLVVCSGSWTRHYKPEQWRFRLSSFPLGEREEIPGVWLPHSQSAGVSIIA